MMPYNLWYAMLKRVLRFDVGVMLMFVDGKNRHYGSTRPLTLFPHINAPVGLVQMSLTEVQLLLLQWKDDRHPKRFR